MPTIIDSESSREEVMTDRQHSYIINLLDRKCVGSVYASKLIATLEALPDAGATGLENFKEYLQNDRT